MAKEIVIKAKSQEKGDLEETHQWPETCSEAISMWGEDRVLELASRAKKIDIQASMRRPANTEASRKLYEKLMASGAVPEAVARDVSGFNPDA